MADFITRIRKKVIREYKKIARLGRYKREGVRFVEPNFIFFPDCLRTDPVVVDAGCGYEADFSLLMIAEYGAKSFALDPTRKHQPFLENIQNGYQDKFTHIPLAVAAVAGKLTFYEANERESGSLVTDHGNIKGGRADSYEVGAIDIKGLFEIIGTTEIDILKLDIEGAEYELLRKLPLSQLKGVKQLFVEFHHHTIGSVSEADTVEIAKRICGAGFSYYSLDDHNILFARR